MTLIGRFLTSWQPLTTISLLTLPFFSPKQKNKRPITLAELALTKFLTGVKA